MKLSHRLRGETRFRIVVVGNYRVWPDNGGYHAERKSDLYTIVDPVSPPSEAARELLVVEAPGTAPGSDWLIASAVYRHSQTR